MADTPDTEHDSSRDHLRRNVEEILKRLDALPTLDLANAEEILRYDNDGVPT